MSEHVFGQNLNSDNDEGLAGQIGDADNFSYEDFVQENVGEGKKYATPEEALSELAKKAVHADTFIETLKLEKKGVETEKEQLAAQLADAKKVDDLLELLTQDPNSQNNNGSAQINEANDNTAQPQVINKEEITSMVRDLLHAEKQAEATEASKVVQQGNQDKAWNSLVTAYGGEKAAKQALRAYIGDDKNRADIINRMGSHQPDSVVEFVKLQVKDVPVVSGAGDSALTTPENMNPDSGQLTWKKVQQIRKDDPKLYRDRKFQMQVHQAAASNPNFWK